MKFNLGIPEVRRGLAKESAAFIAALGLVVLIGLGVLARGRDAPFSDIICLNDRSPSLQKYPRLHAAWRRVADTLSLLGVAKADSSADQLIGNISSEQAMCSGLNPRNESYCKTQKRSGRDAQLASLLAAEAANVQASSPELIQLPICSAATASDPAVHGICEITPQGHGAKVKINLNAQTSSIKVGGYDVVTEHYNKSYLAPVVEALPGDTVAAHLTNSLNDADSQHVMMTGDAKVNPTNLHYFHGGIVSPRNERPPVDASQGKGDNVYVYLPNGKGDLAPQFDFEVPIPNELDARVLDGTGYVSYPTGLNWYHSHLHRFSSRQVLGGMSGLLSVGDAKANLRAACEQDTGHPDKCTNDVDRDTLELKKRTEVKYVLLRDIPLQSISALPEEANGAKAEWAPTVQDFPAGTNCGVWRKINGKLVDVGEADKKQRMGFCQRDPTSAWLFTLNGQRFPTVTIEGNRNVLLRTGNLSSNVAYWLELYNEKDEKDILPLQLLSLDGVVPAYPVNPNRGKIPVVATGVNDLLLMPATRAEIYVRNDFYHEDPLVYVLRTKGPDAGVDVWPEIQLARFVLKPNLVANPTKLALNAPIERALLAAAEAKGTAPEVPLPYGCVRDLMPEKIEHRRVTFFDGASAGTFAIKTEIVHPPQDDPGSKFDEGDFVPSENADPNDKTTIQHADGSGVPFEDYELKDGIDWEGKTTNHVCIRLDHVGSHDQLWVLWNTTGSLHNFHIHQMKFRLARQKELEARRITPPKDAVTTCDSTLQQCPQPEYRLYETADESKDPEWHDTIPIPSGGKVFLIMSFDAPEQIGRFVFHCHILKHEDNGLMAPIEVWNPHPQLVDR